ncbi:MAG: acyl-CoA dehydrogenase family protein [Chloroflexi bacterium]|nr:acyl-CoA dehydrogenase family protein [Chloroflexota bacterium]
MDFRFSEAEERLRSEVRQFLQEHMPELDPIDRVGSIGGLVVSENAFEKAMVFNKKLAERGWIAPGWPKEYGGLDASIYEQMVFNEEFGYVGPPDTGTRVLGVGLLGPTLIVHGTDEQKREHLSGITSAEVIWCQGFSEPGAGSDLASLQTRAVRDGDDYIISGQKSWTSEAHHADWMFLLARTDPDVPKHKGISFFLLDMKTPGITVQPMIHMANRHHFNDVFFDNVRVPKEALVGEENRGWYVGMTLLDFERSGIIGFASQRRTLETMLDHLRSSPQRVRDKYRLGLAELMIDNHVGRCLSYRIGDMQAKGQTPSHEGSAMKVFQSDLLQRMANFGVKMLGLAGQLLPEEPKAPYDGEMPESYMTAVPATIYAGSNEIQRNIIATRGLGLPRG